LFLLGIVYYLKRDKSYVMPYQAKTDQVKVKFQDLIDRKLIYWMSAAVAVLVFFQAHFNFGPLNINLNIADIFAICGLVIFLCRASYLKKQEYRVPYTKIFCGGAVIAFSMAFIWGLYQHGFTGFSFFSKFIGFFILLGYAAMAYLFVNTHGITRGAHVLLRLMLTVTSCIILIQTIRHILEVQGLMEYNYYHASLCGYAGNRNAFGIQMLCVAALQLSLLEDADRQKNHRVYWILGLLFAGVFFTHSRSSMITSVALLVAWRCFGFIKAKDLQYIATKVFLIIAGVFLLENSVFLLTVISNAIAPNTFFITSKAFSMFAANTYSPSTSDPQRIYTIMEGLRLWMENPLFGIGLGGFAQHEILKNGIPLVIHNTFVWFLTEFGIVGFSLFFWYGFTIVKYLYCLMARIKPAHWRTQDKLLFSLIIVFVLMGNAHEIFYQRILWFMLGIAMVSDKGSRKSLV
jgi:O-antigen ligase/polysaccharide polymerase Wzy-like membrane protein